MLKPELNHALIQKVDAEDEFLMDPETWDWDSTEEAVAEPSGYSVIELRLPHGELAKIDQAASTRNMTLHTFLRLAALKLADAAPDRG